MSNEPRTTEGDVRSFWEAAALTERDRDGLRPTARDPYLQVAVENAMEPHISRGSRLLDLGCGDGLTTMRFARTAAEVVGVDYIEQFVHRARENAERSGLTNATFTQGSVLALKPIFDRLGLFDVAVSIRCLINLSSREQQAKAVEEIASCVRPGGLYLASEGWSEGMDGLNAARAKFGLPAIATAQYNLLMEKRFFVTVAAPFFEVEHYRSLGLYLFMSRVVQPVVVAPAQPRHDHPLNEIAVEFLRRNDGNLFNECDYAGVYVLRRR
jgi:ubiquinone/menaquinone biosynthesis C-methylase UbiE